MRDPAQAMYASIQIVKESVLPWGVTGEEEEWSLEAVVLDTTSLRLQQDRWEGRLGTLVDRRDL